MEYWKKHISSELVLNSDMYSLREKIIRLFILLGVLYADAVPVPPEIPEIQSINEHEKIYLMWDNTAESSIDSLTGYSDFEGYRIYRSTDGGQTWGDTWDRIYDYSGNFVGWRPYAQFDLIEELDSLHCIYPNPFDNPSATGY